MKRLLLAVFLCLSVTGSFALAQDSSTGSSDVDCSRIDDAGITSSVKERFSKSPALKDAGIGVETKDGVVTLTGKVKTGGLKGVATRVTRRVNCVKKVDNRLSVEPGADGKGSKSNS